MAATIITPEDLKTFKLELLEAIQKLFNQKYPSPIRRWLKSHEVRRILTISPAKLQKLRDEGTLPYTKIGQSFSTITMTLRRCLFIISKARRFALSNNTVKLLKKAI